MKRRMDDDHQAMRRIALGTIDRRHTVGATPPEEGHVHHWGFHPTAAAQCIACKTVTMDTAYHEAMDAVVEEAAKLFTDLGGDTYKLEEAVARVQAMRAVYRGDKGAKWPT